MGKKHFTEAQIAFALRQHDAGTAVAEIIRKLGVSEQRFYRWKIGLVIRTRQSNGTETGDVQCYISSLKRNVKLCARAVRSHWSIENACHWTLDMTFREDESRVRERRLAESLAWLRRFALGLLKQHPAKKSLVMKRRIAGWNVDFLSEVLFSTTS